MFSNSAPNYYYSWPKEGKPMAVKSRMTRREMLTGAAGAAMAASAGALAGCFPGVGGDWPDAGPDAASDAVASCGCAPPDAATNGDEPKSSVASTGLVATIQRDDSIDSKGKSLGQTQLDATQSMVDALLSKLAGGEANPWPTLIPSINSCTRVGIKVNCLNSFFPTSPAVVRAIIASLITKQGICPTNILVWDRRLDELQSAWKNSMPLLQGALLRGTFNSTTDLGGPGYTEPWGPIGSKSPRLSRILTEQTDVTINCPVLKTHGQSGITAALKNVYGVIDNPGDYHGDLLQTALPEIYRIPQICNSIKLTVVDALQAVTSGDTADRPTMTPGRIFASRDPIALDRYAYDLINQLRTLRRQSAVEASIVSWIDYAHQLGLGTKQYTLVEAGSADTAVDGGSIDS
jgi:uncharacterized protein (DUF362 family)